MDIANDNSKLGGKTNKLNKPKLVPIKIKRKP